MLHAPSPLRLRISHLSRIIRLQLAGNHYTGVGNAFTTILRTEGVQGLYKGIVPNAIKVVPNNAIRFLAYDFLKKTFSLPDKKPR